MTIIARTAVVIVAATLATTPGAALAARCGGPPAAAALVFETADQRFTAAPDTISDVHVASDINDEPGVSITLCGEAAAALARLTAASIGEPMTLRLDGRTVIESYVVAPISDGRMMISGGLTEAEAEALVDEIGGAAAER